MSKPRLLKADWTQPQLSFTEHLSCILDLEIPAPPPPLLLDNEGGCDDNMPTLPPPMDYDISAPPQYLDKGTSVPHSMF